MEAGRLGSAGACNWRLASLMAWSDYVGLGYGLLRGMVFSLWHCICDGRLGVTVTIPMDYTISPLDVGLGGTLAS